MIDMYDLGRSTGLVVVDVMGLLVLDGVVVEDSVA